MAKAVDLALPFGTEGGKHQRRAAAQVLRADMRAAQALPAPHHGHLAAHGDLRAHAPQVQLSSIVLPELRVASRTREQKVLAIGPKAAWVNSTDRFVNMVEGGGLWGFAGICTMARLMREAWAEPKDTRDLVPRKGLGCVSCV